MESRLRLSIHPQPTDTTCGPTCLQAVYSYFGDELPLSQVISEVRPLETGGTLAVFLAHHALHRGYRATIFTYNLQVFDPTWFVERPLRIAQRIEEQLAVKDNPKIHVASHAYLEFLKLGGRLCLEEMRPSLIRRFLKKERPILTGLSATYLYGCARETPDNRYDAIHGEPQGHFVVLCGYDPQLREVMLADPLRDNPLTGIQHYTVGIERVIGAILLGILTYDANLLIIEPV